MPELLERLKSALADRYAVESEIGRGGMATVFLAEDLKHHRKVAIKVLHPDIGSEVAKERFFREIEIVAGLTHPNILPLHDSGQADGLLYCVMPYIEGESLLDRLQREKQLSLEDALQITREVADALCYAHERGIIHRDIKPANILLQGGHALVADFGIARALEQAGGAGLTQTGVVVGTPTFMSPEHAAGGHDVDGRTDIYALGCVLYQMLAGSPPYVGVTPLAVMKRHSLDPVPSIRTVRDTIPESVEYAITKALAKVPTDRYQTAGEFANALLAPDLTGRPIRRRRVVVLALVGVTALLAGVWYLGRQSTSDAADSTTGPAASIAVLPFVPLSSGEDDGYFADGLTEEILNALTQLSELQVTARTSSFFFKGKNVPVPEIAARLNVAHIVEGSVRRDNGRVRITAQLIRAADGFHLWSQSYDRTLDDVFAVQEDIAESIAEALGVLLDDDARQIMRSAGIRDVEAFIAYQKGLEAFSTAHQQVLISEPLAIANAYFDRALVAAPGLAEVRVWKADQVAHVILEIAGRFRDEKYPGEAQEALATLREEYDLAVQLSPPGNQRDILDLERTLFSDDWGRLPDRIQKAMQPGECPQINWTNEFIVPFGWAEQLAEKARETLACDPMHAFASVNLARSLIWTGDPVAALQAVEEAANKGLSFPWLEDGRYWALLAAGHLNDPALSGPGPKGSLMLYDRQILLEALAGDPVVARQMAEEYWSGPDADDWSSLMVAAVVGDRERANEIAARIDSYPGSAVVFSRAILNCFCGGPFDLEATPNYKARIEEAGFSWPPPKRIDYPTKTW